MKQSRAGAAPVVWQIVGYKNSGKTTLICALIPLLRERGKRVAVIKHDTHGFEIDHPHTDTWKQKEAGAGAIAITNGTRTAIIEERSSTLPELIAAFEDYDFVLVEGFKNEHYPKLVLLHAESDIELLSLPAVSGVVLREEMKNAEVLQKNSGIHQFTINEESAIVDFICQ